MHPTRAALGNNGAVCRGARFLFLPIIVLAVLASGCRSPADPQSPPEPPPEGFTLRGFVLETVEDGEGPIGAVLVEITSGDSAGRSTTTDARGAYSFVGLTGQLNLRFSKDGFVPTGRTVNMTADLFLNVRLERDRDEPSDPGETFVLSGTVRRGQGDMDPIAGAVVEVVEGERAGDSATTDSLGNFSIPGLSGEIVVRASRDGFDPEEETLEMTEDRMLTFSLVTPPMVSMCLDLDDEEVHITNDDTENELILTDWTLWEIESGNSFVFVEDRECRPPMQGLTVAPGETVIITSGEDPEHAPPTRVAGWCDEVWDNDGDTARLVRPGHGIVIEAVGRFASCEG